MSQPASTLPKTERASRAEGAQAAQRTKSVFREYAEALLIALALALVIRTFLLQAYKIPSGSMEPTLLIGDHILVNKLVYGLRMPESILGFRVPGLPYGHYVFHLKPVHRGDVVVFVFPPDRTKDFIKRVVAVGGDTIEIRDGVLFINGSRVEDRHAHYEIPLKDHTTSGRRDNFGPLEVPAGKLFMMGDNRDRSWDSRWWGLADVDDVEGKAVVIYWSWDGQEAGLVPLRWNRFGKVVE